MMEDEAEAEADFESDHIITTTNRLFLSHINYKNYTYNDEMISNSNKGDNDHDHNHDNTNENNNGTNSRRSYLSQEEVKTGLKELFSNYGTVQDIYLSDGKKLENNKNSQNNRKSSSTSTSPTHNLPPSPFGFLAMETTQEAQLAINNLTINKKKKLDDNDEDEIGKRQQLLRNLFRDLKPAKTYKSKNNTYNKKERKQKILWKEYRERISYIVRSPSTTTSDDDTTNSNNNNTANIICQISTSHLERFKDYVLNDNTLNKTSSSFVTVKLISVVPIQKCTSLLLLQVDHRILGGFRDMMLKIEAAQRPDLASEFIQELEESTTLFTNKIAAGTYSGNTTTNNNDNDNANYTSEEGGGHEGRTVKSSVGAESLLLKNENNNDDGSSSSSNIDYLERFSQRLWDTWYIAPNLNRITILNDVDPHNNDKVIEGNIRKGVVTAIFDSLYRLMVQLFSSQRIVNDYYKNRQGGGGCGDVEEEQQLRVRVAVFPPKLQNMLLLCLDEHMMNNEKDNVNIVFTPTNPTHTISVIQLHPGVDVVNNNNNDNDSHDKEALYVLGRLETNQFINSNHAKKITKNRTVAIVNSNKNKEEESNSISRAYWKLQEAWERYQFIPPCLDYNNNENNNAVHQDGNDDSTNRRQLWALDCGAAPGGWTKFLFRPGVVERIYSIDPGKLSNEVLPGLDNENGGTNIIRYMDTTIQKAMPLLVTELHDYNNTVSSNERGTNNTTSSNTNERKYIDIWVSDMNVKDMSNQIDYFLLARHKGLIGTGTFFVLTIKCVVGYSTIAFDSQTKEQVQRLTHTVGGDGALARDVHVVHLFSNRTSERTIIGYLI